MDVKNLYLTVYKVIGKQTPLKVDCGKLCGKSCCQKAEADAGMYLFPGEETMFNNDSFFIRPANFEFSEGEPVLLAACRGGCERGMRPLACRFFPLIPYLTKDGILTIKVDPRAKGICPLASSGLTRGDLNPEFIQRVRRASRLLLEDEDISRFLFQLSRMIDEYTQMPWFSLFKA